MRSNSEKSLSFSAIVTFHREGLLAHRTLRSIDVCRQYAESKGIRCRILCSLDNADATTSSTVKDSPFLRDDDIVVDLSVGDLGTCRNELISLAKSDFVGTFDGDDYFSSNWIYESVILASSDSRYICHPEIIVTFGGEKHWWRQPDQLNDKIDKTLLFTINPWNACMVTNTALAKQYRYSSVDPKRGVGFEDWHWNSDTMAAGKVHRTVPQTTRFERRKLFGSLCSEHESAKTIIGNTPLFD
ncbi:glycosyltransferase [Microbulbifer sp. CNSA002]|uniref:glycosyltransferase n=1 Tax=unclassified Microbulbifer TaxID=2619833 RepID=UPI0039B43921